MNLAATIIEILKAETGTGQNGDWKRQDVVVETIEQYPKKVCISFWNDKIDNAILKPGNRVQILITIKSKEFSGKWYHDIRANKVELIANIDPPAANNKPVANDNEDDVLPF